MDASDFVGIPDEYNGKTLIKRYSSVQTISSIGLSANLDTYILQLPTPGVAFWWAQGPGPTFTFVPVLYSDTTTLFPLGYENTNADGFRIASNTLEIIPTVNSMTWTGSIQVSKTTVYFKEGINPVDGLPRYTLGGLEAVLGTKPTTILPFNCGAYAPSRPADVVNNFDAILSKVVNNNITISAPVGYTFNLGLGATQFLGCGSQEVSIFKVPTYSVAGNAGIIRTWSCVEYQVNAFSALYEYQSISPPHDPLAMQLATEFFNEHSSAVPYYENENFWSKVAEWIRRVSGTLSVLPGPYGNVAKGVNMISNALIM